MKKLTGTMKVAQYVELEIKRPDGKIEIVKVTPGGLKEINDNIFKQMIVATKNAGRGDILTYKNIYIDEDYEITLTDADMVSIESDRIASMMAYGEK